MTRIGVYGTLKRGEANARLLRGARFVGGTKVHAPYRLHGNREYPMLTPSAEIHPLFVEIYLVDRPLLEALDRFEGRFGYRRVTVMPEGGETPLDLYVHPGPPPPGFEPKPEGDWNGDPPAFAEALRRVSR